MTDHTKCDCQHCQDSRQKAEAEAKAAESKRVASYLVPFDSLVRQPPSPTLADAPDGIEYPDDAEFLFALSGSGGNTYNETGNGGVVVGGQSPVGINEPSTGGIVAGGSAGINTILAITATGGVLVGSKATDGIQPASTGGVVIGGQSTPSWIAGPQSTGGALAGGMATVTSRYNSIASTGGILSGGSAPILNGIPISGGCRVGGMALLNEAGEYETPVTYSISRVDEGSFLLSFTSSQPAPVHWRVFREGVQVADFTSPTNQGSYHLAINPGESPFVEALDRDCAIPSIAFPGKLKLNWLTVAGAQKYLVQEMVASSWQTLNTIQDLGQGAFTFQTAWLADVTTYQFQVVPQDAAQNNLTPLGFTVLQVRHPDVVEPKYSYSTGTQQFTLSL